MRFGWIVSAAGHVVLLTYLLVAGTFSRDPLPPLEVADVTVISAEEFAILMRPDTAPDVGTGAAAPEAGEAPRPPVRPPAAEPETEPEPAPEEPAVAAPPELTAPPPVEAPPQEQPPAPTPSPRVAPTPAPAPPEDAAEAPEAVADVEPEAAQDPVPPPEETETRAPQEAAPEIVTEAETPRGAPEAVPRPPARPDRVARLDPGRSFEAASPTEPEPAPEAADPLAAALAEALGSTPEAAPVAGAASGPPLSQGERDAFRVAVEQCWNVDPGSPAAAVTVTVGMRMTRDAKPDTASISLLGAQGGDDGAVRTAYEAARRAILRCGAQGFPLPSEKYERWAQVEMTFNPEGMRVR